MTIFDDESLFDCLRSVIIQHLLTLQLRKEARINPVLL
jgi:hypothetical protein